jgi:hypothetical protein
LYGAPEGFVKARNRFAGFLVSVALSVVPVAAAAQEMICGDVDDSGEIVATDALLLLGVAVGLPGLQEPVCPVDLCGDGVVSLGEDCDQGNLNGANCSSLGLFGDGLACGPACVFDTVACSPTRFIDNGDGTLTDKLTSLQWEKKTDDGSVHDTNNTYTWSVTGSAPDGSAFVDFLGALNGCVENAAYPPSGLVGGFAGHCDWRLPSVVELQTIVDMAAPGCGSGTACIDPLFGPTINYNYWTATTFADYAPAAWFADFDVGQVEESGKSAAWYVRAVRGPL